MSLWISNTGDVLDSPVRRLLDMELRALYYAIEHINGFGQSDSICDFEDACSPSGRVSKKAAIELMKFADK